MEKARQDKQIPRKADKSSAFMPPLFPVGPQSGYIRRRYSALLSSGVRV